MYMGGGTPKPLDTLHLLVHPGYSIQVHSTMTPEENELLETLVAFGKTIDRSREAMVVLLHRTEADLRDIRSGGPKNIEWPILQTISGLQSALQGRVAILCDVDEVLTEETCQDHSRRIKEVLTGMGTMVGAGTRLVCTGETASSCVPRVAKYCAQWLGISSRPQVPLALTNARKPDRWRSYRDNGENLEHVQHLFPEVDFVPIPSDFGKE